MCTLWENGDLHYDYVEHVKPPPRTMHDDVIKWKHFPGYWPFVRGIHRSPVNSPHKGQWRGTLICVWINGWINNREAGDLRCYRAHYDVTVMNGIDLISLMQSPMKCTLSLTYPLVSTMAKNSQLVVQYKNKHKIHTYIFISVIYLFPVTCPTDIFKGHLSDRWMENGKASVWK